jgi:hypothetical protein
MAPHKAPLNTKTNSMCEKLSLFHVVCGETVTAKWGFLRPAVIYSLSSPVS